MWTKQSFEEALGQSEELGLKIVPCAKPRLANYRPPRDPQQDRVFLAVRVGGVPGPDTAKIGLLRRSGYPLAVLTLPRGSLLSRYMQFVHYSVFGLAWLRGMNFAARPGADFEESIASRIFDEAQEAGGASHTACLEAHGLVAAASRVSRRPDPALRSPRPEFRAGRNGRARSSTPPSCAAWLAERRIEYGDLTFFGDTRYSPAGVAVRRILDRAAESSVRAAPEHARRRPRGPGREPLVSRNDYGPRPLLLHRATLGSSRSSWRRRATRPITTWRSSWRRRWRWPSAGGRWSPSRYATWRSQPAGAGGILPPRGGVSEAGKVLRRTHNMAKYKAAKAKGKGGRGRAQARRHPVHLLPDPADGFCWALFFYGS